MGTTFSTVEFLDKHQRSITTDITEVEFVYPENGEKYTGLVVDKRLIAMAPYIVVETKDGNKIVAAQSVEIIHVRVRQHTHLYIQNQLCVILGHMPTMKLADGPGLDMQITASGNKAVYGQEAKEIVALADKTGATFWFESVSGKTRVIFKVSATAEIIA